METTVPPERIYIGILTVLIKKLNRFLPENKHQKISNGPNAPATMPLNAHRGTSSISPQKPTLSPMITTMAVTPSIDFPALMAA
jgi:hypothetical protein